MCNKAIEEFLSEFEKLSPEMQRAVYWLVKNVDFVDEMVAMETASKERLEQILAAAKARGDVFLEVIIAYELMKKYGDTQR